MHTGELVAVKKIPVKSGKISKECIKLEIEILRQLSHPHLVKYMGYRYSAKQKTYSIVLELIAGGSMESYIKSVGCLKESEASRMVYQILLGLDYLHKKKVIHRDLKPANILLTLDKQIKITDFGISTQLINMESTRKSCVGTPYYLSPEVIKVGDSSDTTATGYSFTADIWSLGCTLYEMIVGNAPYFPLNHAAAMYRMAQDDHPPYPNSNMCSTACMHFLQQCWIKDWKKRPNAEQLLNHEFVKINY